MNQINKLHLSVEFGLNDFFGLWFCSHKKEENTTNALIMPSTFVEVKDEEVEYIDGSWNWWNFAIVVAITIAITAAFVFICAAGAVAIPGILVGCGIKCSLAVGALYGLDALGASIANIGLNALINGVIAGLGL